MNTKYFLFFIFVQFFTSNVYSSKNVEISSIDLLSDNKSIDDLLIVTEEIRTTDFQKFEKNLKILINSRDNFNESQQCFYDYLYSYKQTYIGEFKQALEQLSNLSKKCNDIEILVRTNALLSNLYVISGNYQKAISHLDYIISVIDDIKDKRTKHIAYTVSFVVYEIVNQWQLSLKFAELLINDTPTQKFLCKGEVYKFIAKLKLDIETNIDDEILDVIDRCQQVEENAYAQALNMGWVKKQIISKGTEQELSFVLEHLIKASQEIENTKYKNLIGIKNSLFAQIYEKLKNPELALKYANLAIENSLSIGDTEQKIDALEVLINHHQNTLDYQTANKYLLEKNTAEKKLYSDNEAKIMAYQTVKHDSLAKTHQITFLNQKNELLSLENKLALESKTSQRLINILLATLLVFFLFLIYRIRKQQKIYKKLSELDHMTLVYNRKGARDYMNYLLPYSEKKNEVIAYGIFDLDEFKKVNDKFGHVTGDWVIKKVVSVCKSLGNEKITFARLGGEEFSITIRDSSLEEVKQFSEKCRLAIYDIKTLKETGFDFQISASFGITTTNISGYKYLILMKHADTALYAAKNNGRNQVSLFEK